MPALSRKGYELSAHDPPLLTIRKEQGTPVPLMLAMHFFTKTMVSGFFRMPYAFIDREHLSTIIIIINDPPSDTVTGPYKSMGHRWCGRSSRVPIL